VCLIFEAAGGVRDVFVRLPQRIEIDKKEKASAEQ
jgi:hypothetical protein